ncbi:MAG: hypothetical protein PVJ67_05260 [Candidatus Pacearchaeota archaeon]|jgi:hypothetical protein
MVNTLKYLLRGLRVSCERVPGDNERVPDESFYEISSKNAGEGESVFVGPNDEYVNSGLLRVKNFPTES